MKVLVVFIEQVTVLWFDSIVKGFKEDKFILNLAVDGTRLVCCLTC